jgi:hypothetical protein
MVICKKCKYWKDLFDWDLCKHNPQIDPISGREIYDWCSDKNPGGECPHWEERPSLIKNIIERIIKWVTT